MMLVPIIFLIDEEIFFSEAILQVVIQRMNTVKLSLKCIMCARIYQSHRHTSNHFCQVLTLEVVMVFILQTNDPL